MEPTPETTSLAQIVRLVPILFHRLRAVGDSLHARHDISTPMRGVMQSLYDEGPQTVPQMAAARPVSRQHIQTIVDALAARDLVRTAPNPAHKRSSLIALTEAGHTLFAEMRATERAFLATYLGGFDNADVEAALRLLAGLAARLDVLARTGKHR